MAREKGRQKEHLWLYTSLMTCVTFRLSYIDDKRKGQGYIINKYSLWLAKLIIMLDLEHLRNWIYHEIYSDNDVLKVLKVIESAATMLSSTLKKDYAITNIVVTRFACNLSCWQHCYYVIALYCTSVVLNISCRNINVSFEIMRLDLTVGQHQLSNKN